MSRQAALIGCNLEPAARDRLSLGAMMKHRPVFRVFVGPR